MEILAIIVLSMGFLGAIFEAYRILRDLVTVIENMQVRIWELEK